MVSKCQMRKGAVPSRFQLVQLLTSFKCFHELDFLTKQF